MDQKSQKIAVFDSGLGGLTVLKALQSLLPYEDFLYLADTARLPYGSKSPAKIIHYTREICDFLHQHSVKLIVMACNTATAVALEKIQPYFSIPLIGVIDPVIPQVIKASYQGRIGILGTLATIQSGAYQTKLKRHLPHAEITATAAPLLVHLVEEGFASHPMTHLALAEYLAPLIQAESDTVILGCTHFPLLKQQIEALLPPSTHVIDPSFACAEEVKRILESLNLLNPKTTMTQPTFYVTDSPEKFQYQSGPFLEEAPSHVHLHEGKDPLLLNPLELAAALS
ncbi:glutamate racemase [Rhabdochlamydiaceae symbiont of Dictyostelium giganteum]|uniref:glutamate racemase n=1 Tax=Rhabdochlamydiaceae symbiont of Dictyostelium giganteum TaxID=3342349 RepID=UPI00384E1CB5